MQVELDLRLRSANRCRFDPVWHAGEDPVLRIKYALHGSEQGQAVLSGLFNPRVTAGNSVQN